MGADAVRLVHDEEARRHEFSQPLKAERGEPLRRGKKDQRPGPLCRPSQRRSHGGGAVVGCGGPTHHGSVGRHRQCAVELQRLVLDERRERRDHQRLGARRCRSEKHRRQLVQQALAAAGGANGQNVVARQHASDDLGLPRQKLVVAKELLEEFTRRLHESRCPCGEVATLGPRPEAGDGADSRVTACRARPYAELSAYPR